MQINLFSIHGFLGKPEDWDALNPMENTRHIACTYEDTFTESMSEWSDIFNVRIAKSYGIPDQKQLNILIGYSLGGRLALHLIHNNPKLWSSAVLISTHPGLNYCEDRINADALWAHHILSQQWGDVMSAWNSQGVFHNSKTPVREECQYNKDLLSKILTHWSVGKQQNFQPWLETLEIPILWCVGANDKNQAERAKELSLAHPQSKVALFSKAGHRVPWDQPKEFIIELESFINAQRRTKR